MLSGRVVQEIGRFDVPVEDMMVMNASERREEGAEVYRDVGNRHVSKVGPEIAMAKVGEYGNHLIGMPESRNEWADGGTLSEVVKKLKLVENTDRA